MHLVIKVISLKNSKSRSSIDKRLPQDLSYSIFDGIVINHDCTNNFDTQLTSLVYGREPRAGEIGCAISHRNIISEVYDEEWLLVLEDDFLLEDNFFSCISKLCNYQIIDPMAILLGHSKTLKRNMWWQRIKQLNTETANINGILIDKRPYVNFCGTVGYMINRSGRELISRLPTTFWIADDWGLYAKGGLKVWHLRTPVVFEDLTSPSSTNNKLKILHNVLSKDFPVEIYEGIKSILKRLKFLCR